MFLLDVGSSLLDHRGTQAAIRQDQVDGVRHGGMIAHRTQQAPPIRQDLGQPPGIGRHDGHGVLESVQHARAQRFVARADHEDVHQTIKIVDRATKTGEKKMVLQAQLFDQGVRCRLGIPARAKVHENKVVAAPAQRMDCPHQGTWVFLGCHGGNGAEHMLARQVEFLRERMHMRGVDGLGDDGAGNDGGLQAQPRGLGSRRPADCHEGIRAAPFP